MSSLLTTTAAHQQQRVQYCTNCGYSGHLFRDCSSPVTSYGVIAVRFMDTSYQSQLFSRANTIHPVSHQHQLQFLLIKRRDSIAFLEFMRGKYNPSDEAYIGVLLRNMTISEQDRLLQFTFDELWNTMWGVISNVRSHKNNYESSEKKYQQIRVDLPRYIQENRSQWTEPEWGFPKGRRNPHEHDMQCAMREFQEETGLKRSDFTVISNTHCITETFFGSNQVHYCHKYYLAICPSSIQVKWDSADYYMSREIGAIEWCSLEEAIARIRPDNIEKREILLKAGKIMNNYYPVHTMMSASSSSSGHSASYSA